MIDFTDEGALGSELQYAEGVRDRHLAGVADLIDQQTGSGYSSSGNTGHDATYAENFVHEYLSLIIPRLAYENPRFSCRSKRMGQTQQVAEAIKHGINRWVLDVDLRKVLVQMAYDVAFAWSCCLVSPTPVPGQDPSLDGSAFRPQVTRIPAEWFIFDPLCLDFSLSQYSGHQYISSKKEMIKRAKAEEGWREEIINGLKVSQSGIHPSVNMSRHSPDREVAKISELWVPSLQQDEFSPEDGFHGSILTFVREDEAEDITFVRDPIPYYGPPWGPYRMGGVYTVRNQVFPLSPLIATKDTMDELAATAYAMDKSASKYKRMAIVNSKNRTLVEALKSGAHDVVIGVENFDPGELAQAEVGGITPQMLQQLQISRERLQNASGMDDALRGNVTGQGTATEHSIAETAATTRLAFIKQQFADVVRGVAKTVAWYLYHDDRVKFPLGEEAASELGMEDPWYQGGLAEGERDDFEDLELELDVYSMERTNEPLLQRNVSQAMQVAIQIATAAAQMPWLKPEELMAPIADAFNMPQLMKAIDTDMLKAMGQAQMGQMGQMGGAGMASGGGGGAPKSGEGPRLKRDVESDRPLMGRFTGAQQGAARRTG